MTNYYIIEVVVESSNQNDAEDKIEQMISESKTNDVWLKNGKEMTDEQILKFFDKTKEEMNK